MMGTNDIAIIASIDTCILKNPIYFSLEEINDDKLILVKLQNMKVLSENAKILKSALEVKHCGIEGVYFKYKSICDNIIVKLAKVE